jgi:hypothetical protein
MAGFTIRLDWQDDEEGGTPVYAEDILRWERGIADALAREFILSSGQVLLDNLSRDVSNRLTPEGAVVPLDDGAGWAFAIYYSGSREVAFGIRTDGTLYPPVDVLKAGIVHPENLDAEVLSRLAPGGSVVELDDTSGWAFAVYYAGSREVAFGVRNDGTFYSAGLTPAVREPGVLIGDSLTEAWGSRLAQLVTILNRPITNTGISGQRSGQIAARQGGVPVLLTLDGNLLPTTTAPVSVTALSESLLALAVDGTRSVDVVSPTGVACTLTVVRTNATHVYTIARKTAGRASVVAPGSPFTAGYATRSAWPIICIGRNDVTPTEERVPIATTIANIQGILDWLTPDARAHALVLTIPVRDDEVLGSPARVNIDARNAAIRREFAREVVEWSGYLASEEALLAAGLVPSSADAADLAKGITPLTLRSDYLHVNGLAYTATAALLGAVYTSRGWN